MNDRHADGHTPGPWAVSPVYSPISGRAVVAPNAQGRVICQVLAKSEDEAHLIAAAPTMLAALREARDLVAREVADPERYLATIDAAIQKATGGSDE